MLVLFLKKLGGPTDIILQHTYKNIFNLIDKVIFIHTTAILKVPSKHPSAV